MKPNKFYFGLLGLLVVLGLAVTKVDPKIGMFSLIAAFAIIIVTSIWATFSKHSWGGLQYKQVQKLSNTSLQPTELAVIQCCVAVVAGIFVALFSEMYL